VHGGGSGIGTFAIQYGRALGARVFATARAHKHDALRALGAEVTIDYSAEDFVAAVRKVTDNRGVDVILDIVGAAYLARNIDALAPNGRLSIISMQGGSKAELNLGRLMGKRGSISATTLRARPPQEKADIVRAVREDVWPLVESGAVRPVVDRRLPMAQAAQAHRVVEANEHTGKVLLTP
jgi:NADPH:quinone reductase-like Zn-dependent oxidoreductase